MSAFLGDFRAGKTVRWMWATTAIAGESITRATNGTVQVYKDGGTTQSTAGVADAEDFDGLTGVHAVTVDTSADGTFYSVGSDFVVVLAGATIDGKAINAPLFGFSIENRSALMPTTDGRKLDVSATGEAGIDLTNVGSPTTTLNLSGTTVGTVTTYTGNTPQTGDNFARIGATGSGLTSLASQASVDAVDDFLDTEIADIRSRLPAALVSGRMDASIGAVAVSGTPLADIGAAVVAAWKADSEVITLLADALAAKTNTDALTGATVAPTAPPAATATPMEILAWLLALSRNKLATTATAITLRNDGDTADIGHAAHAESSGTYTRDEWTS